MNKIRYKKYYLYNIKKELLNKKINTKKEEKGKVLVLKKY